MTYGRRFFFSLFAIVLCCAAGPAAHAAVDVRFEPSRHPFRHPALRYFASTAPISEQQARCFSYRDRNVAQAEGNLKTWFLMPKNLPDLAKSQMYLDAFLAITQSEIDTDINADWNKPVQALRDLLRTDFSTEALATAAAAASRASEEARADVAQNDARDRDLAALKAAAPERYLEMATMRVAEIVSTANRLTMTSVHLGTVHSWKSYLECVLERK